MKRKHLIAVLVTGTVVVGAVALALALRGGSNGDIPPSALTADEWQRQANAECQRIGSELGNFHPLEQDVTGYVVAALPYWRELARKLGALEPPAGVEKQAAAYVAQLDYLGLRLLDLYTANQRQDDESRAAAIEMSRAAAINAAGRADELGLQSCAALGIP